MFTASRGVSVIPSGRHRRGPQRRCLAQAVLVGANLTSVRSADAAAACRTAAPATCDITYLPPETQVTIEAAVIGSPIMVRPRPGSSSSPVQVIVEDADNAAAGALAQATLTVLHRRFATRPRTPNTASAMALGWSGFYWKEKFWFGYNNPACSTTATNGIFGATYGTIRAQIGAWRGGTDARSRYYDKLQLRLEVLADGFRNGWTTTADMRAFEGGKTQNTLRWGNYREYTTGLLREQHSSYVLPSQSYVKLFQPQAQYRLQMRVQWLTKRRIRPDADRRTDWTTIAYCNSGDLGGPSANGGGG